MFKRTRLFAKSYFEAKENEFMGYAMGQQIPDTNPYHVVSPHSMGKTAERNAQYARDDKLGPETANVVGHMMGVAQNVQAIKEIDADVRAEQQQKKARRKARRQGRGR